MFASSDGLRARLDVVRQRIAEACRRAGRPASSVALVAVTKQVPAEVMRQALGLGVTDVGENRVQEAGDKREALTGVAARWHLIGHLQRNKAKLAVTLFDIVHSVDTPELAGALGRHAQASGRVLDALIQVNMSGEATKHGCRPETAQHLAETVLATAGLRWRGLMTIAPAVQDAEQARPHFRRLRELRDTLARALGADRAALQLSMGMSQDFDVAIEEGADLVRIGSAIFHPLPRAIQESSG